MQAAPIPAPLSFNAQIDAALASAAGRVPDIA